MATGSISIRVYPSTSARNAEGNWDEGDAAYVIGTGLTVYDGAAWGTFTANFPPASLPEIAATPTAQGITDALVTLGLVTQAEA